MIALLLALACTSDYDLESTERTYIEPLVVPELQAFYQTDTYLETPKKPVDILFVIDRSCSMTDNLNNLNDNIEDFFVILRDNRIDYQVGITTTDSSNGNLTSYYGLNMVTPETPNPPDAFETLFNSTHGEGERGVDALVKFLYTNYEHHADFLRSRTPLYIITISDENDQSSQYTARNLVQLVDEIVEPRKQSFVVHSAIVTMPGSSCGIYAETVGWKYMFLSTRLQGLNIDICDTDWSATLKDLAYYSTPDVTAYYLSNFPVVETIDVLVFREDVTLTPDDWEYFSKDNVILFSEYEQKAGDIVQITYEVAR